MSLNNTKISIETIHSIFEKARNIFFIGIGGVSMNSLAWFCKSCGKEIFGYDKIHSKATKELEKIGKIKHYSTPDNVTGMDMVIYTTAIDEHNFEYRRAKKLKIPLISRANFLGYVLSLHKTKIGVCGMHGKSTTTAMLTHIFDYALKSPTAFCGAEMIKYGKCFTLGGRDVCIFEACEYKNSFLSLPTTDALILNIDYDHPDFFDSIEDVKKSFQKYANSAHRVLLNSDDEEALSINHPNIVTFGFGESSTYRAEIVATGESPAKTVFLIYNENIPIAACALPLVGKHFVTDALAAFAVAHQNSIPSDVICRAISIFQGNARRMEFIAKANTGADIFEDYAHHPKEVEATLSALSQMGYKNILCVFQAHTYSRTYFLYDSFTKAFALASKLIIAPVFPAREENIYELSEEQFAKDCGGDFCESIEEIAHRVDKTDCDAVVLMGAGDLSQNIKAYLARAK